MTKLIRFDEDHFGYLVDRDIGPEHAEQMGRMFQAGYPGKRLIIMQAEEFIDLTGQYEIVPIPDEEVKPLTAVGPSSDSRGW